MEAAKKGYTQILWLFGKDHYITEVGTMNMFVFMTNEKGERELVTPPLDDGTILPGVTRDSILHLARSWKEFKVQERPINMKEFLTALKQNRVRYLSRRVYVSCASVLTSLLCRALLCEGRACRTFFRVLSSIQIIEAFGAGTAAIVAPIKCIGYRGQDYAIPLDAENPQAGAGKLTKRLANEIMAIQVRSSDLHHPHSPRPQYGDVEHEWSVVVD